MLEVTRTATFTDQQPDEALTTIVARSVLEAALAEDEPGQERLVQDVHEDVIRVVVTTAAACRRRSRTVRLSDHGEDGPDHLRRRQPRAAIRGGAAPRQTPPMRCRQLQVQ